MLGGHTLTLDVWGICTSICPDFRSWKLNPSDWGESEVQPQKSLQ